MVLEELTKGVNPFNRHDWSGRFISLDGVTTRRCIDRALRAILVDGIGIDRYRNDRVFHFFVDQIVRQSVYATIDEIEGEPERQPLTDKFLNAIMSQPLVSREEAMAELGITNNNSETEKS